MRMSDEQWGLCGADSTILPLAKLQSPPVSQTVAPPPPPLVPSPPFLARFLSQGCPPRLFKGSPPNGCQVLEPPSPRPLATPILSSILRQPSKMNLLLRWQTSSIPGRQARTPSGCSMGGASSVSPQLAFSSSSPAPSLLEMLQHRQNV